MKKSRIFAAMAACATITSGVAHAQSSITLYGLIDVGVDYISNQKGTSGSGGKSFGVQSGNLNPDRWGLRGSEDLGGGLSAIFTLENGFTINNGKFAQGGDEFGRQAFVGLASKQYGQVTLGRQYDEVLNFVGPLSAAGLGFGGELAAHPYDNDNLALDVRMNNSVMFRSADYNGLKMGAGYAFSNSTSGFRENNAFTAGAGYDYKNLSLAVAFFQANHPGSTTTGALSSSDTDAQLVGVRQRIYAAAAKYRFGAAEVGAVVTRTSLDGPSEIAHGGSYVSLAGNWITFYNYELNARYALTPALHIGAAYTYTQGHFVGTSSSVSPKWNQLMLQADYALSTRTDVYLEGTYQRVTSSSVAALSDAGIYTFGTSSSNRQAIVAIGLRTKF
ncbi:MAG: porin [Janthinobacterium lividum]